MNERSIFEFGAHRDVMQDKGTPARTDKASGQPSNATPPAYARLKHHGSQKRRVREVSGCITEEFFQRLEVMRHAGKKDEVSRSFFVGKFTMQGIQKNADMQYISMLAPIIEKIIERKLDKIANRLAFLSSQAYYAAGETLILQCKVLSFILGNNTELPYHLSVSTEKSARKAQKTQYMAACAAERPNIMLKCLCIQLASCHVAHTAYMGIFPA